MPPPSTRPGEDPRSSKAALRGGFPDSAALEDTDADQKPNEWNLTATLQEINISALELDDDDDNDLLPDDFENANGLNPLIADDPGQDSDGDTLPVLIEFFMSLDPNAVDNGAAVKLAYDSGAATFTFRRSSNVDAALGGPEYSSNLVDWFTAGIVEQSVNDMGDYVEVTVTVPVNPNDPGVFVRLNVGSGN